MLEGAKTPNLMDPMELWRQWYETSAKVWSNVLNGGEQANIDPYGFYLYRLWMKSLKEAQEQLQANISGMANPMEVWSQWLDVTTDAWKRAAEAGKMTTEFANQWLRIMEETRAKILSGEINSKDPVTFFKQWYDAISDTWSQAIGDIINSEQFMEANRQFIETFTSAVKVSNRTNEEFLRNMQLPTRSDIARVAELVVTLEEKIDRIEDSYENLEDGYSKVATSEAMEGLAGRLEQVESKLGGLDALPNVLKGMSTVEGLAGRLDRVEGKLDTLLNALEKLEVQGEQSGTAASNGTARRKTAKKAS